MMPACRTYVAVSALIGLSACGTASSSPLDSFNHAHCVAAFYYGRQIALGGPKPNLELAVQSTARFLFEGKRMEADGTLQTSEMESAAVLSAHGRDTEAMTHLLLDCARRQDADPAYRALNETGQLMAAARKTDPACKSDRVCGMMR